MYEGLIIAHLGLGKLGQLSVPLLKVLVSHISSRRVFPGVVGLFVADESAVA